MADDFDARLLDLAGRELREAQAQRARHRHGEHGLFDPLELGVVVHRFLDFNGFELSRYERRSNTANSGISI